MEDIKNIVFDLGGVLLNIDTALTDAAFEKLGIKDFKNNYSLTKADRLFDDLEKGKVAEPGFYDAIREMSKLPLENDAIRDAWNALLLDFREESILHLEKLPGKYRLYLLSNTNHIHHTAFHRSFATQFKGKDFDAYFTKAYYSHQVGLRKPDSEIFDFLLTDAGLLPGETLFIDDLLKNITAAAAKGIRVHHLGHAERIEQLGL